MLLWGFHVLLSSTVHGVHDADILNLYKHWFTGDGTYYGKTASGICSLNVPNLPPVAAHVEKLVALNGPQMFGSSGCGMCFKVSGTGHGSGHDPITGTFVAYVTNVCPKFKRATTVEMCQPNAGKWFTMTRTPDGFWIFDTAHSVEKPIHLPIKVRLHVPSGNVLVDTMQVWNMGFTEIVPGDGVQFPLDYNLTQA